MSDSSHKIDLIIEMNANILKLLLEHAKSIQELQCSIKELKADNKIILEYATKMSTHIDFIRSIYERVRNSYVFRSILG